MGQAIEGTNGYVSYTPGQLPIVISVPHGGDLSPASIPDRTCNNAVYATDVFTIELAQAIDSSFMVLTGCKPHIVYSKLHRSKMDANRNIASAACGNPEAELAWTEFHEFIANAQQSALDQYDGKAFYIDLHGHGNSIQRLELGYLLYDDELELSDEELNNPTYINYSSIQDLVASNAGNATHAELIRGPLSLGTLFGNAGYPSVPSQQIPFPGTTTNYFSGGYNTVTHTSYQPGNPVNGVQIECNYDNVRDTHTHRKAFADSLAAVLVAYMEFHEGLLLASCGGISSTARHEQAKSIAVYPTIADGTGYFSIAGEDMNGASFELLDMTGRLLHHGKVDGENRVHIPIQLHAHMYVLRLHIKTDVYIARIIGL